MIDFLKKIWDKAVALLLSIPMDKRLHFGAGFAFATFFAIALDMKVCFFPVIFIAAAKELMDNFFDRGGNLWDFAVTLAGSLAPQAFVLLRMWWL